MMLAKGHAIAGAEPGGKNIAAKDGRKFINIATAQDEFLLRFPVNLIGQLRHRVKTNITGTGTFLHPNLRILPKRYVTYAFNVDGAIRQVDVQSGST